MENILRVVLGDVFINKAKLAMADGQRTTWFQKMKSFIASYKRLYARSSGLFAAYIAIAPFFNLFILSGLFTMILVLVSDYVLLRLILNEKE